MVTVQLANTGIYVQTIHLPRDAVGLLPMLRIEQDKSVWVGDPRDPPLEITFTHYLQFK